VPEGQEKAAAALCRRLQKQFQPRGVAEGELIYDMAINRMQKRRIDEYAAREFDKACCLIVKERYERNQFLQSQAWLRLALTGDEALEAWRRRLPPNHCISFLRKLKEMLEERDIVPDKAITQLQFVYGGQFTAISAKLLHEFSMIKLAQCACQGDEEIEEN
jgi:hypothetical protein